MVSVHLREHDNVDRDDHDRLLHPGLGHDRTLRARLVGDGQAAEGTRQPAGNRSNQAIIPICNIKSHALVTKPRLRRGVDGIRMDSMDSRMQTEVSFSYTPPAI